MWVKDYMLSDICKTSADTTVKEAVKKMVQQKTNSLIIVDDQDRPIGTLSSHTLIRETVPEYLKDDPVSSNFGAEGTFNKYAQKIENKIVSDIMYNDTHILSEDDTMIEAAAYTVDTSRRILPVADKNGKCVGAITRTCIKNALYNVLYPNDQVESKNGGCCNCEK